MAGARILVVDDEPNVRTLLQEQLEAERDLSREVGTVFVRRIFSFVKHKEPEKGKLLERVGRKAIGLNLELLKIRLQGCQA